MHYINRYCAGFPAPGSWWKPSGQVINKPSMHCVIIVRLKNQFTTIAHNGDYTLHFMLCYFRIDIFVLLDLIGAGDMSFMKLESSTSENRHQRWLLLKLCPHSCVSGDWYDRLVTIERNLRRSTRSLSGNTIFKVHQSSNP